MSSTFDCVSLEKACVDFEWTASTVADLFSKVYPNPTDPNPEAHPTQGLANGGS